MIATHFSTLDRIIVAAYLLATLVAGLYGRKFIGGIADFLVAGRELGTFLAVATLGRGRNFFEIKFSRNLRVFTGILVATGGILNMGVFLKVEATFLAIISGVALTHIKAVMTGILPL